MLRLLWAASVHSRYFPRRYMPTSILLDLIRTRRGLKWGTAAMLLAAPYLLAEHRALLCRRHEIEPDVAAMLPHHGSGTAVGDGWPAIGRMR